MKRLFVILFLLAAAACEDRPTGVTVVPTVRVLRTLPLSVGQRADITPAYRAGTTPPQVEYESSPTLTSSAVGFVGMDRLPVNTPVGSAGQVQIYHFLARTAGQAVVTIRSTSGTSAVQDTINVQAPAPHGAFAQISSGFFLNTCAVTTRGAAFCWGSNVNNMLGTSVEDSLGQAAKPIYDTPMAVTGGLTFAAVSVGWEHACGLTTGGAAYCWGDNHNGELGNGNNAASSTPVEVVGGLKFKALSVGGDHTCGLTTSGAIYCWGNNYAGELGDSLIGGYVNSAPIRVSGGLTFVAVGAGGFEYSCGLATSGAAYCWGDNQYAELGTGNTNSSAVPVPVTGGLNFVALSTGYWHACGLTRQGAVYCWGDNSYGELGTGSASGPEGCPYGGGTFLPCSTTPVAVSGGLSFASISAGDGTTCGVTAGGVAYCWGWNGYGQVGNGTSLLDPAPVAVAGGLVFASLSTGELHTCGVTTQGAAYCWGDNSEGELGDGSSTIRGTPVSVFGP